jgi:hypothetical protein
LSVAFGLLVAFVATILLAPATSSAAVLDHQFQVGQPFPLLPSLAQADRDDLQHGHRTVILYDHGCGHCRDYLATLALAPQPDLRLIDVSADNRPDLGPKHLSLPPTVDVAVPVPLRVELRDGTVEARWQPQ